MVESLFILRRPILVPYAVACSGLAIAFLWLGFGPSHDMPVPIALALTVFYGAIAAVFVRALLFPKIIETSATGVTLYHPFAFKSRFIHWEELAVIDLTLKNSGLKLGVKVNNISNFVQVPVVGLKPYPMIAARQLLLERTNYYTIKNAPDAEAEALGLALALEQPEARFHAPEDFFMSPFVLVVLLLNFAYTTYAIISGMSWMHSGNLDLVPYGAGYPPLVVRGEAWRLIAHALLHNGVFSLFFESLALVFLSRGERLYDDVQLALIYFAGLVAAFGLTAHLHPYDVQVGGVAPLLAVIAASIVRKFSHPIARRRSPWALGAACGLVLLSLVCTFGTLESVSPLVGLLLGVAFGYLGQRTTAQNSMAAAGGLSVLAIAIVFLSPKPLDALGSVERSRQTFEVIREYAAMPLKVGNSREECDSLDRDITEKQIKPTQAALEELAPLRAISEEPTRSQVQKLMVMGQDLALGAKVKLSVNTRRRRDFTFDEDMRSGRLLPEQGFAAILEQWLPEIRESEPPFLAALSKTAAAKLQADDAKTAQGYMRRAQALVNAALRRDLKADVKRATVMLESNDPGDPLLENAQVFVTHDFVAHAEMHRVRLARLTALGQAPDAEATALLRLYTEARLAFNAVAVDYSVRRRFKRLSQALSEHSIDPAQCVARVQTQIVPYLVKFALEDARQPAAVTPTSAAPGTAAPAVASAIASAPAAPTDIAAEISVERRKLLAQYEQAVQSGKPKLIRAAETAWRSFDNGALSARALTEAKRIISSANQLRDGV